MKTLLLLLVLLCGGCDTLDQRSLVGCYSRNTVSGAYALTFNSDGTAGYSAATDEGWKVLTGVWSVDGNQLTVSWPDTTTVSEYVVTSDGLVIVQDGRTITWTSVICAGTTIH